jgi:hypothetical protein
MSTFDIVFLSAAISAFIVFAAVLAWAEYRTRHIGRPVRTAHAETVAALKAASTGPEVKSQSSTTRTERAA